ncbi:tRNA lysidine(34) synthetase TilS [bacterium]|nr:MAG: tRNA lysidine(34) synthetase TilS [bacterium]
MDITQKFRDNIAKHGLLEKGARVLAAVSGGADSMVLLHLLLRLKDDFGLVIGVCHLNHNLRAEESKRDYDFVKKTARSLGFVFYGKTLSKTWLKGFEGESLQSAARERRYAFFESAAMRFKASKVALGHTMSDQAETLLISLVRGSGLAGLAGIPAVRGKFIRPLLTVTREEVEDYAKRKKISFITDSSNLCADYLRNDIRLNLIAFIKRRYNPNIIETLSRTSGILSCDNAFIEAEAEKVFSSVVVELQPDFAVFDRRRLVKIHKALQARILPIALNKIGCKSCCYSAHISSFVSLAKGRSPNASVNLPDGYILSREYDKITLGSASLASTATKPFDVELKVPGITRVNSEGAVIKAVLLSTTRIKRLVVKNNDVALFDSEALSLPLHARSMRPGDRINPFGMTGTKKLKEVFIEKKIPKAKRSLVPVICDLSGGVIWVAGVLRSNLCRVTGHTKKALSLEVKKLL